MLAIGAQPDDIEIQAGGAVIKALRAGRGVVVCDACEGEMGSNGSVEDRRRETLAASEILGLESRVNLQLRDGFLGEEKALLPTIVKLMRELRPRIVITHPLNCRHPDHSAVARAVKDAYFFTGAHKYLPELKATARPERVYHFFENHESRPDLLVDISEVIEIKKDSILAYRSQFLSSAELITDLNSGALERLCTRWKLWGQNAGVGWAEPYNTDLPPLLELL
ncbi:MAG: bacillithiol biosynthesis deacetylase BshB1 [Planctomycetes bacterium]|nr:bacillithiol biosynthesis deacetylase BshB1 [Planctomycetota bacterium]